MRREDPAPRAAAGDPSGLLSAFLRLPEQLASSYEAARDVAGDEFAPRSIIFCGMGGSAAGGDVVGAAFADRLSVPVASVRGYRLPPHCGPDELVVCLSFSGDTEETLACFDEAVARGARIVAVCSGGKLAERAEVAGAALTRIPADVPMPRAGLGYLAGAATGALEGMGVLPSVDDDVKEAREALGGLADDLGSGAPENEAPENEAMEIATAVGTHVPVAWGSEGIAERAAFRWKAAFNENAKIPAFASALPELSHHEVAGWTSGRGHGFVLILLRHEDEHPSVPTRLEATLPEIQESGIGWREVRARGAGPLAHILSLILLGDAASVYHALARGVDPGPIEVIERVKARLSGAGG